MSKPNKTAADYMVIAASPVLIMALVGSLCFFLIEVFYRGKMLGGVCWVMFWFIIGIVLVSRIAIEKSSEHAALYGLGLAVATWLYMIRTQPAYLIGIALLAIVWFCAHKLVWDCTLIDDDQDSSGQGLLQKTTGKKEGLGAGVRLGNKPKPPRKVSTPHAPGRWVIYFSVAALPLFGVGQMLLPAGAGDARRNGFLFLASYLAAALGLLVTTSFLGLRRYLRQRYLKMPPTIAVAWLKFGIGVVLLVLIGAIFLPRPGANAAWTSLRYHIDYQLQRASQYAMKINPPGQGPGQPGNDTGGQQGQAPQPSPDKSANKTSVEKKPGETPSLSQATPAPALPQPVGNIYNLLRDMFWIVVVAAIAGWVIRRRHLLMEIIRSIIAALRRFFLDLTPARKTAAKTEAVPRPAQFSSFSQYKNPFFAAKDYAWPPEQIVIYSYEAVQVWAKEQGLAAHPEMTAREFCAELSQHHPQLDSHFAELARLYAHAAYAGELPPNSDLEPLRELWRQLPTIAARVMAASPK